MSYNVGNGIFGMYRGICWWGCKGEEGGEGEKEDTLPMLSINGNLWMLGVVNTYLVCELIEFK